MPLKNRYTLARAYNNLLVLYRANNELDKAVAAFMKSKTYAEDIVANDATDVRYLNMLAVCHQNVGLVYAAQGNVEAAESAHRRALEVYQQAIELDPNEVMHRRGLAQAQNNLALLYTQMGLHEKAEEPYMRSLEIHKAIVEDHPKIIAFRLDLGGAYGNMASHVRRTRSAEESLEWTAKAISTVEPVLTQNRDYTQARLFVFDGLMGRAYAFVRLDRRDDAVKDWREMLEVSEGQPDIRMRAYRPFALVFLGEHAKAAAADDSSMTDDARRSLADQYAYRAVELLQQARSAGLFQDPRQVLQLEESNDFAAVSTRADFQQLVAELKEAGNSKP